MKKIFPLFIIVLLLFGIIYYVYNTYVNFIKSGQNFVVEIKKGEIGKQIINKMCDNMNTSDCWSLKFFSISNSMGDIKPGEYTFSGENIKEIFEQFKKGPKIIYAKFTIIPGDTKFDIVSNLEKTSSIEIANKFKKLMTDKEFIKTLNYRYEFFKDFSDLESLEGFLLPDTYFFKPDDLESILFPELLIKTALKNFDKKRISLKNKCKNSQECNPSKLTYYQILKIASILQKEGIIAKNQPIVADLYIRRFLGKRKLGADRTLCYGLGILSKECQNALTYKNLQDTKNVYNTRALVGLMPTPVGNPTFGTIKSTFFPKKNEYWYYLHDTTGLIHFGKTAQEHNLNKQKYIR